MDPALAGCQPDATVRNAKKQPFEEELTREV
jgi:hypothetical protein